MISFSPFLCFLLSYFLCMMIKQQSSLSEKWATTCSKVGATSSSSHEGLYKYVVYKEPLSLDRFYIHDVTAQEGAGKSRTLIFTHIIHSFFLPLSLSLSLNSASNLKHSFILVCTNRFQQVITCHTFQAPNDGIKVCLSHFLIFLNPNTYVL